MSKVAHRDDRPVTGFTDRSRPVKLDGVEYPSIWDATKRNYERLGMSFEAVYGQLIRGATKSTEMLRKKRGKRFQYKGKWYTRITDCAKDHNYSDSAMRKILKDGGFR